MLLPARLVLGFHALPPPAWLWKPAAGLAGLACVRTARHGRTIVGVTVALLLGLVVQLPQVGGSHADPLRAIVVVTTVMAGLLATDAALARRLA